MSGSAGFYLFILFVIVVVLFSCFRTVEQATVAVNRVLHGPGYPSQLTLPVISR